MRSSPRPAQIVSLPPRERITSSPPKETMTSSPRVPVMRSSTYVPTMVALYRPHEGVRSLAIAGDAAATTTTATHADSPLHTMIPSLVLSTVEHQDIQRAYKLGRRRPALLVCPFLRIKPKSTANRIAPRPETSVRMLVHAR